MPTATPTRRRLAGPMSKRLRAAREDAGYTQKQLSEILGVHLKTVNNYENPTYGGARKSYVVRAWAETCGRGFEELLGTPDQPLDRTGCRNRTAARHPSAGVRAVAAA